ncbi:MAG TPA: bifunctional adenosylcobinamide kinase/adenosylcobinamide-phosphate guanylyltransferase [Bryobacteraceae bacterium]|nr:bifunctional adenosylcobinamide kinase/adenosylcobinamide-phosphate guanylyltransferase [Bryobacteraceae bacterium]
MLTLVIGGARSGKSRFAQSFGANARRAAYIATARAVDAEMAERIARHRQSRPAEWITVEEPLEIACAVAANAGACDFVLLDCLTVWLSNLCWEMRDCPPSRIEAAAANELARLAAASVSSDVVLVSNEVGWGVVPDSPVGRLFRDLQGWVNQDAARAADRVYLMVAGIPVTIKPPGERL